MNHTVVLTYQAQKDYEALYKKAQRFHDPEGLAPEHSAVVAFKAVNLALEKILPYDPDRPELTLAGIVSYVYRMPLDPPVIWYKIDRRSKAVVVLTIDEYPPDTGFLKRLAIELERGDRNRILAVLGISPPLSQVETSDSWVM